MNIILNDSVEKVYSLECGVTEVQQGVSLIRGDNIATIGEVDLELEAQLDMSRIKAAPLPVIHN